MLNWQGCLENTKGMNEMTMKTISVKKLTSWDGRCPTMREFPYYILTAWLHNAATPAINIWSLWGRHASNKPWWALCQRWATDILRLDVRRKERALPLPSTPHWAIRICTARRISRSSTCLAHFQRGLLPPSDQRVTY